MVSLLKPPSSLESGMLSMKAIMALRVLPISVVLYACSSIDLWLRLVSKERTRAKEDLHIRRRATDHCACEVM